MWRHRWVIQSKFERSLRQVGEPWGIECSMWTALRQRIVYGNSETLHGKQKDSSQETVISLMGMLVRDSSAYMGNYTADETLKAGSVLVSYVSSPMTTWSCLILLLSIHLAMNRAAVRAVSMHTLNRQRANIVFSTFLDEGTVLSPKEVSLQERIFEWDGVLRWRHSSPLATAKIGHPLKDLLASLAPAHEKTGSIRDAEAKMMRLIRLYSQEEFLLWYDAPQRVGHIALKEGAAAKSQLKAWALMLWITHRHRMDGNSEATSASFESTLDLQRSSLQDLSSRWADCIQRLRTAGWDIDVASLETISGSRICVQG